MINIKKKVYNTSILFIYEIFCEFIIPTSHRVTCLIKNKKVIHFLHSKKNYILVVHE